MIPVTTPISSPVRLPTELADLRPAQLAWLANATPAISEEINDGPAVSYCNWRLPVSLPAKEFSNFGNMFQQRYIKPYRRPVFNTAIKLNFLEK
ncbi:MAG: hypothetical protein ACYCZ6_05090 [Polaromonas sp.]